MVLGISMRYLRCLDDANDVTQETFISVYDKYDQYDPEKKFEPWLRRIAVNTALMYIRKNYRYELFDHQVIEDENSQNTVEVSIDLDSDFKLDLIKILQKLPDGYRTVFNLSVFEGLDHKEIAEYLEISESTSRSQLWKARKMLKAEILKLKKADEVRL